MLLLASLRTFVFSSKSMLIYLTLKDLNQIYSVLDQIIVCHNLLGLFFFNSLHISPFLILSICLLLQAGQMKFIQQCFQKGSGQNGEVSCSLIMLINNFIYIGSPTDCSFPNHPCRCRTCGGSGLGYCSRCLGTGEYRYLMGFHFMNRENNRTQDYKNFQVQDNLGKHRAEDFLLNNDHSDS